MSDPVWYVRDKGRVMGPFTPAQFEKLKSAGRVTRLSEISPDRNNWLSAASLFEGTANSMAQGGGSQSPSSGVSSNHFTGVSGAPQFGWYYAQGKDRIGPIAIDQINQFIGSGAIVATTQVWNNTMADWVPAAQAEGLRDRFPEQHIVITDSDSDRSAQAKITKPRRLWLYLSLATLLLVLVAAAGAGVYYCKANELFYFSDGATIAEGHYHNSETNPLSVLNMGTARLSPSHRGVVSYLRSNESEPNRVTIVEMFSPIYKMAVLDSSTGLPSLNLIDAKQVLSPSWAVLARIRCPQYNDRIDLRFKLFILDEYHKVRTSLERSDFTVYKNACIYYGLDDAR